MLAARGSEASWLETGVSSQLRFQEELPRAVDLSKCPPHTPQDPNPKPGSCEGEPPCFQSLETLVSARARCIEGPWALVFTCGIG